MIWIIHIIAINVLFLISYLRKNENFFLKSTFIYSLIVFGQRWMVGTDFPNYLRYYLRGHIGREPLYFGLQELFSSLDLYFGLFIFLTLFITLFNNFHFIKKLHTNKMLVIYIYMFSEIYFAQMSQIRQFIAISFFINAFYYAYQNQFKKAIFISIFGSLFHISGFFVVPFLFIRLRWNKVTALYALLIASILPFFNFSLMFKLPIFSAYSRYVDSIFNVNLSVFHYLKFYFMMIIFIFVIWNLREKNSRELQMLFSGLIWYLLFYGASFQFAPFMRVSFYFKIFEITFVALVVNNLNLFSKAFTRLTIISVFIGIFTGFVITDPYNIQDFQWRPLTIRESRSDAQLEQEVADYNRKIKMEANDR